MIQNIIIISTNIMWQNQNEGENSREDESTSEMVSASLKSCMSTRIESRPVDIHLNLEDNWQSGGENVEKGEFSIEVPLSEKSWSMFLERTDGIAESCQRPKLPLPSLEARQVATRVIRHARNNKIPSERELYCVNCNNIPKLPVTGKCGHTRCSRCIQERGPCPCGTPAPESLHVNILVQQMIDKIIESRPGANKHLTHLSSLNEESSRFIGKPQHQSSTNPCRISLSGSGHRRKNGLYHMSPRLPMSTQARFEMARQLVSSGRYREAAPHLARIAAAPRPEPRSRLARVLLAQTIEMMSEGGDPRRLTRELFRSVRSQGASSWLRSADLECVLCFQTYKEPVTTSCGHTYCRSCISRAMAYTTKCPLCSRALEYGDLAVTRQTSFVCAALASVNALSIAESQVLPIFVCTVAYPGISCPLLILEPRCCLMVRQVLQSGSRKIGMVPYESDGTISEYGTVLQVCDCVNLEDGRCIISTVGVYRFRVLESDRRQGFAVARIEPLIDRTPIFLEEVLELVLLAKTLHRRAKNWLLKLDSELRAEIECAFGPLPKLNDDIECWWERPHGPAWLWWLTFILPLPYEMKILILSSCSLTARMKVVHLIIEQVEQLNVI